MLDWIERQRKKPKYVRNRYAFWVTSVATLVIALFWVVSVPAKFNGAPEALETGAEELGNLGRVMDDIKANVANTFDSIKNSAEDEIDTSSSTTQKVPTSSIENEFDFSFILASTTKKDEIKIQPKRVLIGTTSSKISTTSKE